MQFTVATKIVKAMLICAGKADNRGYLNNVRFHAFQSTLVVGATDGHRLLAAKLEQEIDGAREVLIPRDVLERAIKAAGKTESLSVYVDGDDITIRTEDESTLTGKVGFGKFPDFDSIFSSQAGAECGKPAKFNGDYIADFCKIAKILDGNRFPIFNIEPNGNSAAIVRFPSVPVWGLLMPRTHDDKAFPSVPTSFRAQLPNTTTESEALAEAA